MGGGGVVNRQEASQREKRLFSIFIRGSLQN